MNYPAIPHAHPLRPLVYAYSSQALVGLEAICQRGVSDFQGWRGITSVVRWNLCPIIVGVESCRRSEEGILEGVLKREF